MSSPVSPGLRRPRRLRRTLFVVGVCWLVLASAWVARRWWAVHILESRAAPIGQYKWDYSSAEPVYDRFYRLSPWLRLLPTSSVTELKVRNAAPYDSDVIWALRVCGRLKVLSSDPPFDPPQDGKESPLHKPRSFLAALGPQPALEVLDLRVPDLSEQEFALLLRQSPRLRKLSFVKSTYSCTDLPLLAALEEVFISYSPVSDAGLAALLRCPSLQKLTLGYESKMTKAGIAQIPKLRQPALRELEIVAQNGIRFRAIWELNRDIRAACPGLTFGLNRSLVDDNDPPPPEDDELVPPLRSDFFQ